MLRVKDGEKGQISKIDFSERRYLERIYDTEAREVLLLSSRQSEKCVVLTTPIAMADGRLVEAGDVRVGDVVATMRPDGTIGSSRVSWVSAHIRKPCLRVETRQGHILEAAATHPIRVWNGWADAGDMCVGDRLAAVRQCGSFVGTHSVEKTRLRLTAYLIGDGSLAQSVIGFTKAEGPVLSEFLHDIEALGGTYRLYKKKTGKAFDVRLRKLPTLCGWLKEDGLLGKKSAEKFVPDWVFSLTREDTSTFLNRLWATDGHVSRRTSSRYLIAYCSTSLKLVEQVQSLLWKFRIPTRIRKNWPAMYKRRGEERFAYILSVETKDGVTRFLRDIGALGKSEGIPFPERDSNSNLDTLPFEVRELIDLASPKRAWKALAYPPTYEKVAKRVAALREDPFADQSLVTSIEEHLNTDLYWDRVKAVTPLGDQVCVDFEVEGTHNFIASGLVTHNSTTLGNRLIALSAMNWYQNVLFVTPSASQTKVFSAARVDEIVDISPMVKALRSQDLTWNILEKELLTRSRIYLRYAFLNADRIRGISVNSIFYDEVQDLLKETIPVIKEAASRFRNALHVYSGTPKTLDNSIERLWSKSSTMAEWVVPCEAHFPWHWNILGPKNIGLVGPICEHCGKAINPEHPKAQWVEMRPKSHIEGYRICRLMVPWYFKPDLSSGKDPHRAWKSILHARATYPTAQFMNEVLAISYDSGDKPLSQAEVIAACDETDTYMMDEAQLKALSKSYRLYAGIDWGCHDEQTRVLTTRGFVFFKDLTEEDKVAQWNPADMKMSFVKPKSLLVKEWDQPLDHYTTKGGVDLMVTHTHKMLARAPSGSWKSEYSVDTRKRSHARFVGCVDWDGKEEKTFTLPGLPKSPGYQGSADLIFAMDDWLELLGYLITEGGVWKTAEKIQSCLDRLGVRHSQFPNENTKDLNWTICGKQYWDWYAREIGTTSADKRLPRWIFQLSKRQLAILFEAMMAGDGHKDLRPGCTSGTYTSTSRGLCEDFQEVCIRLGLRCSVSLQADASGNKKAKWSAIYSRGREYALCPKRSVKAVPYRGRVYCCSVDTGHIVTERNGKISYQGNSGENTFSVITIGAYVRNDTAFQILYSKRFDGQLVEPEPQMAEIIRLISKLRIKAVGCDYGMGFVQNKKLTSIFSAKRIFQFQYAARAPRKVQYKAALNRSLVFRTAVMADVFSAIKNKKIRLPSWEVYKEPYAEDMLSIYSEYSNTLRMLRYDTTPGTTDDTFHSILYCLLASFVDFKRPDIIAPIQDPTIAQEASAAMAEEHAMMEIEERLAREPDF